MTSVVVVVATVTLAITYNASIYTVRAAAQRLAASTVDTVATRVSNYMNVTEDALTDIVTMANIEGYRLPQDDPSPHWYRPWMLPMRTLFGVPRPVFNIMGFNLADGGLMVLGDWWVNESYVYAYAMSAATLATTGKTRLDELWLRRKGTYAPWDPATMGPGFQPLYWGDERNAPYYLATASLCNATPSRCSWMPPFAEAFSYPRANFVFEAHCCVRNKTGTVIGVIEAITRLDDIDRFLRNAVTTPMTKLFVVDNSLRLIGSSFDYPVQHFINVTQPASDAFAAGCTVEDLRNNNISLAEKIGCRATVASYPYPPLQTIAADDPSFLVTPGRDERYGDLAGRRYYYIAVRIPSTFLSVFTTNLVLFLPESDVLGGLTDATNSAAVICSIVFAVAAAFANILVHFLFPTLHRIRKPGHQTIDDANAAAAARPADDNDTDDEGAALRHTDDDLRFPSSSGLMHRPSTALLRTALIFDVVGFGALCDRVPASKLTSLFRHYVERMSAVVQRHGGTVERFLGDCLVSYFATPTQHEMRAGLCALALQCETRSDPLSAEFKTATEQALRIRCGIATGVAGRSGTCEAATQASQLLSLNRVWGTEVLMSDSTAQACMDIFVLRQLPICVVLARDGVQRLPPSTPLFAWDVIGVKPDARFHRPVVSHTSQRLSSFDADRDERDGSSTNSASFGLAPIVGWQQLAREGRRNSSVAAPAVAFATTYTQATQLFLANDTAGCESRLRDVDPSRYAQTPCVERLRLACIASHDSPLTRDV